ncbi:HutD/Ves family protein [Pragia fontium]|uniref:HutD/Ves family protein n=1 Tax=Pragia fontium TaxID=82985 RepID=UPI000F6D5574|nr:HutD family protein [Pragia fontium]VEJ56364.1 Various environmental stresses-induced protein [Pragia fontium]
MKQLSFLRATDYLSMPWRNGDGVTKEICRSIDPTGSDFAWRFSSAEVGKAGPFSSFTGYQRIISVLKGKGIQLHIPDQPSVSLRPLETFAFSGDLAVDCALLDGPVIDLNLIYRPDRYSAHFQWITEQAHKQSIFHSAPILLLFNAGNEIQIEMDGQLIEKLGNFDTLWLKNPQQELVELTLPHLACCAVVALWPKNP